jgi:hypothetical protein
MTNDELMKVLRKLYFANIIKRLAWLLGIFLLFSILINIYQGKNIYKYKAEGLHKSVIIDSLDCELQNSLNINTRYEITLDYLKEIDSNSAKKFENFLNKNTE